MTVSSHITSLFSGDLIEAVATSRKLVWAKRPDATLKEVNAYLIKIVHGLEVTRSRRRGMVNFILERKAVWESCDTCGKKGIAGYAYRKDNYHFEHEGETCGHCGLGHTWELM